MSSRLTSESRIYADKARDLNRQVSFIRLINNILELSPLYSFVTHVMRLELFSTLQFFFFLSFNSFFVYSCRL